MKMLKMHLISTPVRTQGGEDIYMQIFQTAALDTGNTVGVSQPGIGVEKLLLPREGISLQACPGICSYNFPYFSSVPPYKYIMKRHV
jgi:hypothetical protein